VQLKAEQRGAPAPRAVPGRVLPQGQQTVRFAAVHDAIASLRGGGTRQRTAAPIRRTARDTNRRRGPAPSPCSRPRTPHAPPRAQCQRGKPPVTPAFAPVPAKRRWSGGGLPRLGRSTDGGGRQSVGCASALIAVRQPTLIMRRPRARARVGHVLFAVLLLPGITFILGVGYAWRVALAGNAKRNTGLESLLVLSARSVGDPRGEVGRGDSDAGYRRMDRGRPS